MPRCYYQNSVLSDILFSYGDDYFSYHRRLKNATDGPSKYCASPWDFRESNCTIHVAGREVFLEQEHIAFKKL